ncbi:MAG TPA: (2Fe-2S)-binding protein [Gemmatimonadaceae bacterium]|jgi:xanthine dehydrogenase YagT iron-sulfur-binding subunit
MTDRGTKGPDDPKRVSRRGFLTTVSSTAAAAAVAGAAIPVAAEPAPRDESEPTRIVLNVNGRKYRLGVEPRETLISVLRERLGLIGAKPGCERGECGACTVLLDGTTRYSCMTLAVEAQDKVITTVEGLAQGEELSDVQKAFVHEDGYQCGFCTPGQVMAAEGLLRRNPNPSIDEIRLGMSGNLCRCGAYGHIFKAVQRAASTRKSGGAQ